jgi:hypothetical protein
MSTKPKKPKVHDHLEELRNQVLQLELATPPTADPRETLRRVVELIEKHQSGT